jgi:hypothetical protein
MALGTSTTTDLYDLRYLKSPLLQFAFQDERTVYTDLKFLHSDLSNYNGFVSTLDYLSCWDRIRGDTLLYGFKSTSSQHPLRLQSAQNLTPFKADICGGGTAPFLPNLENHYASLLKEECTPDWPNMIGCVPIISGTRTMLYRLYEDGSLFSTIYSSNSQRECIETIVQSECKENSGANDLMQNHQLVDASQISKGTKYRNSELRRYLCGL